MATDINPLWGMVKYQDPFTSFQQGAAAGQQQQTAIDRRNALQQIAMGQNGQPDYAGVSQRLLAAGDIQGAQAVAQVAQNQHAQRIQDERLKIEQGQYDIARKNAEEKPTYQTIEDDQGNKRIVQLQPRGGGAAVVEVAGLNPPNGNNSPYAPTQKITEDQAKSRLWVDRMASAHKVINANENINQGAEGYAGGVLAGKPGIRDSAIFNTFASPERQKTIQAQRDFVNALLRRESGAAISQGEFENAQKQYFPQPGDGPEVLAQKRANRQTAIEGMMSGAGKGYKPPADYVGTKGPAYPNAQPTQPAQNGSPKQIGTQAEYQALASGSQYIAPDGSVRTKQ